MGLTRRDETTAQVEEKLASDERTKDRTIEVSAQAGKVTLRGGVASDDEKAAAEAIAQSVAGVDVVINELVVQDEGDLDRDDGHPATPLFVPGARAGGGYPYGGGRM